MDDQLYYTIAATQLKGLGPRRIREIIAHMGSIDALFTESLEELRKLPVIGHLFKNQSVREKALDIAEKEMLFISQNNISAFIYTDDAYPFRLKQCDDAPIVLYVKGDSSFSNKHYLSIVGTRRMTSYGKALCEKLIAEIAQQHPQVTIVSGLAYGIDVTSHKAALENNLPTIGVIAHGLEKIYPSNHTLIAKEIYEHQGSIVTEYASETFIDPANFVQRNRIIAGLSDAVVIIESAEHGGALFTAVAAQEYNRDVYAFPGRVNDTFSMGCNQLIRNNKAQLINNADELLKSLNWSQTKQVVDTQQQLFIELTEDEKLVVEKLYTAPMHINHLAQLLGLPIGRALARLTQMEFKGIIQSTPGSMY